MWNTSGANGFACGSGAGKNLAVLLARKPNQYTVRESNYALHYPTSNTLSLFITGEA
jgi:hypothetical protein